MAEINWARWGLFFVLGVPVLAWLGLTRNNVLRLLALLGILLFVQDIWVAKRHLVAISVGPSAIFLYVALVGLLLQRGRLPQLGAHALLWPAFLLTAVLGIVIGSPTTGFAAPTQVFQEYYLEGFLIFLVGLLAFESSEEVQSFFFYYIVLIGLGLAGLHLVTVSTGWQPYSLATSKFGGEMIQGGFLGNPNTLGDFFVMTLPVAVVFLVGGRVRGARWLGVAVAMTVMATSLLLTGARGGILFSALFILGALLIAARSMGQVLLLTVGGVVVLALALLAGKLALPHFFDAVFDELRLEGIETRRFATWGQFLRMTLDHPFGVGIHDENILRLAPLYGTGLAFAHNIYLDHAVKTGFLGLLAFLGVTLPIVVLNLRALRQTPRGQAFDVLLYLAVAVNGFLVAGIIEPIYHNGYKLNQLFWLLAGMSLATSRRLLAGSRQARGRSRRAPLELASPFSPESLAESR